MIKVIINKLFPNFLIFVLYVLFSKSIIFLYKREFHPFTLVPMFNNFPNWSYTFYVTNDHDSLIPIMKYFNYDAGTLGHKFYAIGDVMKYNYGYQRETESELDILGKQMLESLKESQTKNIPTDKLKLYRKTFYWENGKIREKDVLLRVEDVNTIE